MFLSYTFFFGFRTGFRPPKGGLLIRLVRRGMHTGQALFFLGIEPGIPRVRSWKELLATGTPTTWLFLSDILWTQTCACLYYFFFFINPLINHRRMRSL